MGNARLALLSLAALLGGTASALAADLTWQPGNGQSCDVACRALGMQPVQSGFHAPGGRETKDPFYICSANYNGYRPGYNLRPSWSNACYIPYGGKEVAAKNYQCGCL
ncbi:hypothetical protein [Ancylobacter terrae]|uniref:hypothetical protein n=1 Tax=Ancylobacter sp. sgz301288 TaxID=3342077 RepID=UPI00385C0DC0